MLVASQAVDLEPLTCCRAQMFVSHCAPEDDGAAAVAPAKLTILQVKAALKERKLDRRGAKPALVARLEVRLVWFPKCFGAALCLHTQSDSASITSLCMVCAFRKRCQMLVRSESAC